MSKRLFPSFFLLTILIISTSLSAAQQDNRAQLQQIRQQIEKAQSDLEKKNQTEVKLSRELALLRQTLKRIDERISELRLEQQQLQKQINQQQAKIQAGKDSVQATGKRLQKRLIALYKEGEVGTLRILFSADSPTELVQQFQYLTRVLHYDKELLAEFRSVLAEQQRRLVALEQLQQQQQQLLAKEETQHKDAKDGRHLQDRLLKHVQRDKKKLNMDLAELQEKAKRLQKLITELKPHKPQAPQQSIAGATNFRNGKGKLNWPVSGQLLIGFGTKKDPEIGTLYESNGFEISCRDNEPILAVADGQVAFSDWFNGYGNLLILSHPGGFHTLYAQAAKLDRATGEQVKAGDLLGYSGLQGRKSIYFEIRHSGTAVDPAIWLKRRS